MPAAPGAPSLVLVVPCFEEAGRLRPEAFESFLDEHPDARLLFVDDGSRDGTLDVLEGLKRGCPAQVELLRLTENRGKGEAVRRGILQALEGAPEWVGYWDADLATPLAEVDRFLAHLRAHPDVEILIGSRVRLLGRAIERRPARHYLGRVAATLVSWMLGLEVYDTQCGAKLFRAGPGLRAILAEPFLTRWIFDVEILARWLARQESRQPQAVERRLQEIPLRTWRDVAGSRIRAVDFLRTPLDLARIHRRYRG